MEPQINEVAEDWVNWFVKFEGSLNQKTFWVVKSKFHCIYKKNKRTNLRTVFNVFLIQVSTLQQVTI